MKLPILRGWITAFLYACACLQFVRFYIKSSDFYLNMGAYLTGHERLPFQERVLPILFLWPMYHSPRFMHLFMHEGGAANTHNGPFYFISVVSLLAAAILTQMLYQKVSRNQALSFLVFPLFLFCVIWTYCIHNEANFSYPYDLLSLAFFTAGLYCIYERRFRTLMVLMFVGTFNRETTLFLVGIYVLDSASNQLPALATSVPTRAYWRARLHLNFSTVSWLRAGTLFIIWLAVKVSLAYHFRHNDRSEDFVRFGYNAARLRIRLIPALLNICGYLLPVAIMYWSRIRPSRFGNYILILVVWIPIMVHSGVLVETRIYGELCSWTAIALALLAEERIASAHASPSAVQDMTSC